MIYFRSTHHLSHFRITDCKLISFLHSNILFFQDISDETIHVWIHMSSWQGTSGRPESCSQNSTELMTELKYSCVRVSVHLDQQCEVTPTSAVSTTSATSATCWWWSHSCIFQLMCIKHWMWTCIWVMRWDRLCNLSWNHICIHVETSDLNRCFHLVLFKHFQLSCKVFTGTLCYVTLFYVTDIKNMCGDVVGQLNLPVVACQDLFLYKQFCTLKVKWGC